ncbi:MAG: hypothetical protein ACI4QU_04800 [Christensenellales bacterium]
MNKKRVLTIVAIIAIVAITAVCLCACNAESIAKKLEKKGYDVEVATTEDLAETEKVCKAIGCEGGIKWAVFGENDTDGVTVIKFAKSADAKKLRDYYQKVGGASVTVKIVGSVFYVGTEQGIKDAT